MIPNKPIIDGTEYKLTTIALEYSAGNYRVILERVGKDQYRVAAVLDLELKGTFMNLKKAETKIYANVRAAIKDAVRNVTLIKAEVSEQVGDTPQYTYVNTTRH